MSEPRMARYSAPPYPARDSAIAMYTATYEHYAESAQVYAGTELCATVAQTAVLFLIAADAEANDPPPRKSVNCACTSCLMYRMLGDKSVPEIERCAS